MPEEMFGFAIGRKKKKKKEIPLAPLPVQTLKKPIIEGAPEKPAKPAIPEIIREQETGKVSGVNLPSGETYLGSSKEITPLIKAKVQEAAPMAGTIEAPAARQQEDIRKLQVETALREYELQKNELSPPTNVFEQNIPIFGTMGGVLYNTLTGGDINKLKVQNIAEREAINQGISNNDKFGAFIETLPIVGSLVNKYARGLISTPSGEVQDLLAQIYLQKSNAVNQQTIAKISPELRLIAYSNVEDIETNIQRLEGRIKLMSIYSAELRSNPEQLNLVEEKIIRTKQYLLRVKVAIQTGGITEETEE